MYIIPPDRKICYFFHHIVCLFFFWFFTFLVLFLGICTAFSLTENIEFVTFKIVSKKRRRFPMKRRLFSIVITVFLIVSLCSCAGKTDSSHKNNTSEPLPELKIGFALYPPYIYLDESGYYTGIDVDIATEACKRMGYKPVFIESTWEKLDSLLTSGKIDCIWGRFVINGRQNDYVWAGPYLKSPVVICTRADLNLNTLNDLQNMTVATFVNSYTESYFLGETDEEAPNIKALYTYSSLADAFAAFNKGYVDAVAGHKNGLEHYTNSNPEAYQYMASPLYIAQLGVAFPLSSDTSVANSLNAIFDSMYEDGFMSEIAQTYNLTSDYLLKGDIHE